MNYKKHLGERENKQGEMEKGKNILKIFPHFSLISPFLLNLFLLFFNFREL